MKNKNETGDPGSRSADPKGGDPEGGAREVAASATGMFDRPLMPPGQPEFGDPGAEFRVAVAGETWFVSAPIGTHPAVPAAVPPAQTATSEIQRATSEISESRAKGGPPGEFTQLFQAFPPNAPTNFAEAEGETPMRSPSPLTSSTSSDEKRAAEAKPGEFTRIFMRLPEPDISSAAPPPGGSVAGNLQATGNARSSETGEFTRLMRAAEAGSNSPVAAGAPVVAPAGTPVRGFSTPGANDAVSGSAGVTELFVAPSQRSGTGSGTVPAVPPTPARSGMSAPPSERGWASGSASSAFPGSSSAGSASLGEGQSGGEFTQLFRALNTDRESSAPEAGLGGASGGTVPKISLTGKFIDIAGGEFTQLMQRLSHEQRSENPPGMPAQPPTSGVASGGATWPEPMTVRPAGAADDSASFTRIISSSAARDEATRGTRSAADTPPVKGGASASPAAPMVGMPQPLQAPLPRAASLGQPPAVAAPASPMPVSPSPGPVSKLQSYLPLLLIVNAFVLMLLVVLVIIALHRH